MDGTRAYATGVLIFTVFVGGCGTIVGNPKKPDGGGGSTTSQYVSDTTLSSNLVSNHIDETIDASGSDANTSKSTSTSLALAAVDSGSGSEGDLDLQDEFSHTCQPGDGQAALTRKFSGSKTTSVTRKTGTFTTVIAGSDTETIAWKLAGTKITCSLGATSVPEIPFGKTSGLTQELSLDLLD